MAGFTLGKSTRRALMMLSILVLFMSRVSFSISVSNCMVESAKTVTLTFIVSSFGYKKASVSTLNFSWISWVKYSKKHCFFCVLSEMESQLAIDGNSSTSFQLMAFNSFCSNSFSEGTCLSKYWQELKNINTKKRE